MRLGDERHAPASIPLGKRPGTHCRKGWVGPRAVLDGYGKSRPHGGLDPWTAQLVTRPNTDYAVPAYRTGRSQL